MTEDTKTKFSTILTATQLRHNYDTCYQLYRVGQKKVYPKLSSDYSTQMYPICTKNVLDAVQGIKIIFWKLCTKILTFDWDMQIFARHTLFLSWHVFYPRTDFWRDFWLVSRKVSLLTCRNVLTMFLRHFMGC